ncbi:hypothetical protein SAMN04489712_11531 [Thermomonospora echinospora]|uniref:Uncharacterized protein n=1 Tax=Thermomonospora echinospora TaxID=1992 RepID=A0A1H6DBF7_9ACTN|nr:hypothetical protein [Thermomonospora echinospora]SEG82474.1 hypothetical protein SAMN04489712_11531 [Thermomonospora echinospora]
MSRENSSRRIRRAAALAVIGAVAGLGTAVVGVLPAEAACRYSYLAGGAEYGAYAYAETADCAWISRSYARHGNVATLSGWYPVSSFARVDIGYHPSWEARNEFR